MKKITTIIIGLAWGTATPVVHADVINNDISTRTTVTWSTEGHLSDTPVRYIQHITVSGDTDFKRLAFNQFARGAKILNPSDTLIEIVPGYYAIASPRLGVGADSVTFDIETRGRLINFSYAPDGFHRVNHDGTTEPTLIIRREPTANKAQWQFPVKDTVKDEMPYGPVIYNLNESLLTSWTPGPYDIIPSYKSVNLTGGTSTIKYLAFNPDTAMRPEHYRIQVSGDSVIVTSRPQDQWLAYAPFQTKVMGGRDQGVTLPNAIIEDYPDMTYRGLMIDIARNYQTPRTMHHILQLMAVNHLNHLHFHIADDEAWRLEIPGLPELTDIGSRRGYTTDETKFLPQIFGGDGNPDSKRGSANGYFTRQDFIDLIKHANALGITVIPEIESPGHARAAIRAMESRHRHGDDTYRLIHDGDTSRYTSAQAFHDNVMNPALPGPYRFMGKVISEIANMYQEADVPLQGIHIGGDEVARGAWNGSAVAQKFMADNNIPDQHQLHAYFVEQIADTLARHGIPMFGWQEVALGHSAEYDRHVRPITGGINCWSTLAASGHADVTDRAVRGGWPVILSNVNHLYFDMSYTDHPGERGLKWGGATDEFSALNAYTSRLCPISDSIPGVIGISAQIFAETIRSPQQLYNLLLPKIAGLSERAWNKKETYTPAQFNTLIAMREIPMWQNAGFTYHVRMPGIKVIDGMVYMNSPYPNGIIRYTTDGSEPTENSPIYDTPFELTSEMSNVHARLYLNGIPSLSAILHP